jgi:chaperonin GroES
MTYTPVSNYILVEPYNAPEKSAGGIHLSQSHARDPLEGTVVAVGPGLVTADNKRVPMDVKVGDVVGYNLKGHEILDGDKKLLLMRDSSVHYIKS